jgi:Na+-transporting NADH:ubiquinone oxidoreductase subunit E
VPAPLRGLGITFITTGLMGIGFQSFGGMLTGGGDETEEANEQVIQIQQLEVVEPEKEVVEKNTEIDEKEISYNDVKK